MIHGFDERSEYLRDTAAEMEDTGKGNEVQDCAAIAPPCFSSAQFPAPVHGRSAHTGHERCRRSYYPRTKGEPLSGAVEYNAGHRGGRGRGMPVPH